MKKQNIVGSVEVGVLVKITAPDYASFDAAIGDIAREVQRVAHRKVLERRYGIRHMARYSSFIKRVGFRHLP